MRKNRFIVTAILAVLSIGVVAYMTVYIIRAMSSPLTTAEAVFATIEVTVPVNGWFAREETAVVSSDTTGAVSETIVNEGEKVSRGQELIVYYDSPEAAGVHRELDALEAQIAQLERAASASAVSDIAKTDSRLSDTFAGFAQASAGGGLATAQSIAAEIKSLVLKRDFTSGRYGQDDMEALMDTLEQRRSTLQARQSGARSAVKSQVSGYFTSVVDGYESVLNMDNILELDANGIKNLPDRKGHVSAASRGKIATSFGWRYAVLLDEQDAARLTVNRWVTLRFNGDYIGEVSVRVLKIGAAEQGQCAVVFSCSTLISELLPYRRQNAEIVLESYDGVRVPKAALRVGEDGEGGVYILEAMQAKFVKVNIIRETEGFYLVEFRPDQPTSIRPGDEIITNSKNLFNGKIIE